PSGTRVVFEGLSTAGFSDLYVIDFGTQQRTAITDDRYRDSDPSWSPDGRYIVFASDRTAFGAEGYPNLFLYDVETGDIRYLTYGRWIDQQPRWSRDGTRIAFSSDRGGVFDLYAVDIDGNGRRLTAMTGGAFDPVWLPNDRGLVFAGYSEGMFRIYRYTFTDDTLAGPTFSLADDVAPRLAVGDGPPSPDALPMGWEWSDLEATVLNDVEPQPYRTWQSFSVDFAGGDAIVAPGVGAAQGAQLLATDMLGNHIAFIGV